MKKTLLCLVLPFAVGLAAAQFSSEENIENIKPKGSPRIKGLYLRMKSTEAMEVLKKLNNIDDLEVGRFLTGNRIARHTTAEEDQQARRLGISNPSKYTTVEPETYVDENNNVIKISFSGKKTSELFGTRAFSSTDFAKKVMESYNIPRLTPNVDNDEWVNGWKYVSDNGWSIVVGEDHEIILRIEDIVKKMD